MSLIRVAHTTTYRYHRPVRLEPHRLMLVPRNSQDLKLLKAELLCEPLAELVWTQDVFGNLIATASFALMANVLVIRSVIVVEHLAPAWPVFPIAPSAHRYPFRYSDSEYRDLGALLSHEHPDPQHRLANWARGFVRSNPTDTLSLLRDVNTGILQQIRYRVREEEGTQAPLTTLDRGEGSCRDLASLFIAAARHLGFAARAVSGYLVDPLLLSQSYSTHAWAEIYLPSAGWIAFDPTHQRVGGNTLIGVAVARSIEQIMPVTGGFTGAASDFLDMQVAVAVSAADSARL